MTNINTFQGNVGIGITNPTSRLQITQDFGGSGTHGPLANVVADDGGLQFGIYVGEKVADPFSRTALRVADNAENVLIVDGWNKRVGIGVVGTTPTSKLEVHNSGTAASIADLVGDFTGSWIRVGDARTARTFSAGMGIKFHDANVGHFSVGQIGGLFKVSITSNSGNELFPSAGYTEGITVDSAGKVGIGGGATQGLQVGGNNHASTGNWNDGTYEGNILVKDTGGSPGNGGGIMFGASQGSHFCGIKGAITNGGGNTVGNMYFYNRVSTSHSYMTPAMTILPSLNVGIRTTNPHHPLSVFGQGGSVGGSAGRTWFQPAPGPSLSYSNDTGSGAVGVYAQYYFMSSTGFLAQNGSSSASDFRIKKDIVDADDLEALETLRLLKPKRYKYKDEKGRGTVPVWGFIAQEVAETLPYSITLTKEFIPNIYEMANVSDSNVITFTNFNTSNFESNASMIRSYGKDDAMRLLKITEVIDEHSVRVDQDLSEWTGSFDESGNVVAGNQLFVYGEEIDDFHFLKKDSIWTVATSALQEIDRQLQAEKVKVITLETQLTSVLTRLDALESA